jgi:hypothetical protein
MSKIMAWRKIVHELTILALEVAVLLTVLRML